MEITVSKSSLYKILNKIDFANESVETIGLHPHLNSIRIFTSEQKLSLEVTILEHSPSWVAQGKHRWDWLYSLCMAIEEQPITLTIEENILKATFEF